MNKFVENDRKQNNKKIIASQIIAYSVSFVALITAVVLFFTLGNKPQDNDYINYKGLWLRNDGNIFSIVNMDEPYNEMLEIPEEVNGIKIVRIEKLINSEKIRWIKIPASVEHIENNIFDYMPSLTYIQVDENNKSYCSDNGILYEANFKTLIKAPQKYYFLDGVYDIGNEVTSINSKAFYRCEKLKEVNLNDNVQIIGSSAFYNCVSLYSVNKSDDSKLIKIGESAFYGCVNLRSFKITKSIINIGESAFSGCQKFVSHFIDEDNKQFKVKNGILYSYDMSYLISYPTGKADKKVTILSNVKRINAKSFSNNPFVSCIVLPDNIEYISMDAFSQCNSLKAIIYNGNNIPDVAAVSDLMPEINFYVNDDILDSLASSSAWTGVFLYPNNISGEMAVLKLSDYKNINESRYSEYIKYGASDEDVLISGYWGSIEAEMPDEIYIDGNLRKIVGYTTNAYNSYTLSQLKFNNNVAYIGDHDFMNFMNLKKVVFGSGVKYIGNKAFLSCGALNEVTFSDAENNTSLLSYIGDEAFANCNSLEIVTLPSLLNPIDEVSIGSNCFMNNERLEIVILLCKVSYTGIFGSKVANTSGLIIVIPDDTAFMEYYSQISHYNAWSINKDSIITLTQYNNGEIPAIFIE